MSEKREGYDFSGLSDLDLAQLQKEMRDSDDPTDKEFLNAIMVELGYRQRLIDERKVTTSEECLHHQSIVRNGNHFIYLDYRGPLTRDAGWVLIDGPWYDYLKGFPDNAYMVCKYQPAPVASFDENWQDSLLEFVEWEELIWERVMWHPGTIIHPRGLSWPIGEKWSAVLHHRVQEGWRLLPGGKLPAFFNHPEWVEDEWLAMQLMQQYG